MMFNKWFILVLLLAVISVTFFILKRIYIKQGRDQVISEYNLKSLAKERKARNEIIQIKTRYEKLIDDIRNKDDNDIHCPISGGVIDSLPNPDSDRG